MKLDTRTQELIAIGASFTAHCQPCLEHHVGKARQMGIDPEEISDAIEVAKMVRKGAAAALDTFVASKILLIPAAPAEAQAGCGCSS